MTKPLRLAFLKPQVYKTKPYWQTERGWVRATALELKFHNQIESLIQEVLTLKRILMQMNLTPEQKEQVHAALSAAGHSWMHREDFITAVKKERRDCANVALHYEGQAWDPHLPAHIAGEILARPGFIGLKLHQCERCGVWPEVTELQPRLNRVTGEWLCVKCMKPPGKGNVASRKKEGLNE